MENELCENSNETSEILITIVESIYISIIWKKYDTDYNNKSRGVWFHSSSEQQGTNMWLLDEVTLHRGWYPLEIMNLWFIVM